MQSNKFLLQSKDNVLLKEHILSFSGKLPEYTLLKASDMEDFSNKFYRGELFDNAKAIITIYLDDENTEPLSNLLEMESNDISILIDDGEPSKNKYYNKLKGLCKLVKIEKLSEKECISWVDNYLIKNKYKFDAEIPDLLVKYKGTSLESIVNEVKKISYYSGDELKKDVVKRLIVPNGELKFFDFIDLFTHKKIKETISELSQLEDNSYISLLHFLINYLDKVYKVAIYKEQKKDIDEIATMVDIPKFIIKMKYFSAIAAFGKNRILKIIDILNDLDLQLRSTKFDRKLIFEYYLMKCFKI